ncbi:uncharacterized protein LOC126788966 isoform X2 [Argentina anserina]|uniref:uncharacterized protein LOC126788966 isoform X2 n=1 Tax=Argentina anserina TaxID=57926 RepID=UPI0021766DDC|nr:uncharacterized protein LOC126788966 isoform X2 [Potentilla anserina]
MQANQRNIADGLSNIPMKRKRGRPRKYPRIDPQVNTAPLPRYQNLNLGENAAVPPPGVRINGRQAQQAAPTNGTSTTDNMVGMAVSGVVEASFDAGYLLRVRVGNTGTTLRGIVFKPGHYAPVVPEIDVAPDVQMIRRHEVPLPVDNQSSVHDHKPHSRDASRPVNRVGSEGRQVAPVAAQNVNQVPSRGNLMPVVLESCKLSNGVALTSESTPVAPQAATVATSVEKQVVSATPSIECSIPNAQVSAVQNEVLGFQPHTSDLEMHDAKPNENGPIDSIDPPFVEEVPKTEPKQVSLPEKVPPESAESHVEASNLATEPLVVKPQQSVEPKDHIEPASIPMEDGRNDKMSELLQESMKERVKDQTEKLFGDGQNDHSSTPSQAS